MNYYIKHIEYYLPEQIIDNDFLSKECGIDVQFLEDKVGIKKRHIAARDETTSDMAFKSALKLFSENKIYAENIDLLILCTQNPDFTLPTTSCIVQHKLGLKCSCLSFDVNLGCSGFPYSLVIAGNFIKSGMINNALIIMADQYSKSINYKDKNTAAIFGDAASSAIISVCDDHYGVIDSVFGTDGSNADKLIVPNSGVNKDPGKSNFLFMDGREIFKFSIRIVPQSVNEILERNNLSIKDIKYFVFHQANKYMLGEIQKKLCIDDSQMVIDMEDYGNTVSSTIPIAYKNLCALKKLSKGDLIIFSGFGVGLSWGTILYRYTD
jgi:3-oxoacyl-[acyl-carrier-protein] synthase III